MRITFLGAGVFGSALAKIAEYNGHEIRFYDPIKYPELSLQDTCKSAELIVFTAPSSASHEILPKLPKDLPLVCASKGFLSKKPFGGFTDFSALGGAAFADEIIAAIQGSAESTDDSEDDYSQDSKEVTFTVSSPLLEHIFSAEKIKIEYTDDTLGIMLAGALKNVYAIGAGLYGDGSVPTSYLESVVSEMSDILEANGAKKSTLSLSCGVADLVLSCTPNSRNYRYGSRLNNNINIPQPKSEDLSHETVEGVSVIGSLKNTPDFIIPESASIFRDIVSAVKSAE